MIEPYTAVGLIPSFWGIRGREDMAKNLEHIESLTHAAFWLSNLDIPVRLIAIPEGALQGFNDYVLDVDHVECARNCAIDIPGPEIGRLGIMMAMEGSYRENGRGLALNGAVVVYRASLPAPFTENDFFEISNLALALENKMYVVAPNIGGYHLYPDSEMPIDAGGGQ